MHHMGGVPPNWTSGICWYVVVCSGRNTPTSTSVLRVWVRDLIQLPILVKVRLGARSDCGFHECAQVLLVLGTWFPCLPFIPKIAHCNKNLVVSATEAANMFHRFGFFWYKFVRSPLAQVRGFLCSTTGISHIPLLAACRQIATAQCICYNQSSRSSTHKI